MINIADIHDCFGCGVCAKACPKQIIALKLNKNGFYEPRIESADQCIKCSICGMEPERRYPQKFILRGNRF